MRKCETPECGAEIGPRFKFCRECSKARKAKHQRDDQARWRAVPLMHDRAAVIDPDPAARASRIEEMAKRAARKWPLFREERAS